MNNEQYEQCSQLTFENPFILGSKRSRSQVAVCTLVSAGFFEFWIVWVAGGLCRSGHCVGSESVCLFVCMFVHLFFVCPLAFLKTTNPIFLYVLPVAVASSLSDNSAIRCVLPVLCFHIMWSMHWNQRQRCFVEFARWKQRRRSCCLRL